MKKKDKYVVAVVGSTGVVGREMIKTLEQRKFPVEKLIPFASERSRGLTVEYKRKEMDVEVLTEKSFEGRGIDIALFSAGGSISEKFAPIAAKTGCVCIDNTSFFRMREDIPLVVPEVNAGDILKHKGIIANPNCSTAQLVVVLKPIHDAAKIKRIVISTYQAVSGAGKEAIEDLEKETKANLVGKEHKCTKFPYSIAFNAIPQIDVFTDNGYTKEEMKMIEETKKILGDDSIAVTATTVRIPVFVGHSEAVNIETVKKISAKEVRKLLKKAPGVKVVDDPKKGKYPTPRCAAGEDPVYVGRIRDDVSCENGIELWCVADNLRKGAALNAVQIAEELIK